MRGVFDPTWTKKFVDQSKKIALAAIGLGIISRSPPSQRTTPGLTVIKAFTLSVTGTMTALKSAPQFIDPVVSITMNPVSSETPTRTGEVGEEVMCPALLHKNNTAITRLGAVKPGDSYNFIVGVGHGGLAEQYKNQRISFDSSYPDVYVQYTPKSVTITKKSETDTTITYQFSADVYIEIANIPQGNNILLFRHNYNTANAPKPPTSCKSTKISLQWLNKSGVSNHQYNVTGNFSVNFEVTNSNPLSGLVETVDYEIPGEKENTSYTISEGAGSMLQKQVTKGKVTFMVENFTCDGNNVLYDISAYLSKS